MLPTLLCLETLYKLASRPLENISKTFQSSNQKKFDSKVKIIKIILKKINGMNIVKECSKRGRQKAL